MDIEQILFVSYQRISNFHGTSHQTDILVSRFSTIDSIQILSDNNN